MRGDNVIIIIIIIIIIIVLELVSLTGEKISSHAHKTGSWYLYGVLFQIFDGHSVSLTWEFLLGQSLVLIVKVSDMRMLLVRQSERN